MVITKKEVTFNLTLSEHEIEIWMAALRMAAKKTSIPTVPWFECCFLKQHKDLSLHTGYAQTDHQDLTEVLMERAEGVKSE